MKYKVDVVYKGIAVQATVPVTVLGACDGPTQDTKIDVQMPGDVEVHVEGELSFLETYFYLDTITSIFKKLG